MALTVKQLKTFIHPTLLEQFEDIIEIVENKEIIKDNETLVSSVEIAIKNYNSLVSNKPEDAIVRFDSETYQVKIALIHIYDYVLHDTAMLHSLALSGMSLSEDQVFQHYLALKEMEQKEVNEMRKEFLDEVKAKEDDTNYNGVMLYHRYGSRSNGRYIP